MQSNSAALRSTWTFEQGSAGGGHKQAHVSRFYTGRLMSAYMNPSLLCAHNAGPASPSSTDHYIVVYLFSSFTYRWCCLCSYPVRRLPDRSQGKKIAPYSRSRLKLPPSSHIESLVLKTAPLPFTVESTGGPLAVLARAYNPWVRTSSSKGDQGRKTPPTVLESVLTVKVLLML